MKTPRAGRLRRSPGDEVPRRSCARDRPGSGRDARRRRHRRRHGSGMDRSAGRERPDHRHQNRRPKTQRNRTRASVSARDLRQLTPGASGEARLDTLVKTKTPALALQSFTDHRSGHPRDPAFVRTRAASDASRNCTCRTACRSPAPAGTAAIGGAANANGAARSLRHETAARSAVPGLDSHSALRGLRVHQGIEASHTGPHGLGQKSSDFSAIPLCYQHHRTGKDSYHKLGPQKFSKTMISTSPPSSAD